MREVGILIRDASNFEGLESRCFRVAAQGREENDLLIKALKEWIFIIALAPLILGWILDMIFGDPERLPHPVVGFGKAISF